jgi:hypothetical protein
LVEQTDAHWTKDLFKIITRNYYHYHKWPDSNCICLHVAIKLMTYMFKLKQNILGKIAKIISKMEQVKGFITVMFAGKADHSKCRLLVLLSDFTVGWK